MSTYASGGPIPAGAYFPVLLDPHCSYTIPKRQVEAMGGVGPWLQHLNQDPTRLETLITWLHRVNDAHSHE